MSVIGQEMIVVEEEEDNALLSYSIKSDKWKENASSSQKRKRKEKKINHKYVWVV